MYSGFPARGMRLSAKELQPAVFHFKHYRHNIAASAWRHWGFEPDTCLTDAVLPLGSSLLVGWLVNNEWEGVQKEAVLAVFKSTLLVSAWRNWGETWNILFRITADLNTTYVNTELLDHWIFRSLKFEPFKYTPRYWIFKEQVTALFYSMLPDFRNSTAFWKVPRIRPFGFLLIATSRRKGARSVGGMMLTGENRIPGRETCSNATFYTTNLAPTGIRSPDLLTRSESLYWLSYSGPPVTAVQWNNRCLFWDPYETYKYNVWAERTAQ